MIKHRYFSVSFFLGRTVYIYICEWFKSNKLSVNVNKCNYMIFHNGTNADLNDLNIVLDNVILPREDKVKFLGVYLDSSL